MHDGTDVRAKLTISQGERTETIPSKASFWVKKSGKNHLLSQVIYYARNEVSKVVVVSVKRDDKGEAEVVLQTPDWNLVNAVKDTSNLPYNKKNKAGMFTLEELEEFQRQFKQNPEILVGGKRNMTTHYPLRTTALRLQTCPQCKGMFSKEELNHHKSELCPNHPGRCGYCKVIVGVRELAAHFEVCYDNPNTCTHCSKKLKNSTALSRHKGPCKKKIREPLTCVRGHRLSHNAKKCTECAIKRCTQCNGAISKGKKCSSQVCMELAEAKAKLLKLEKQPKVDLTTVQQVAVEAAVKAVKAAKIAEHIKKTTQLLQK